MRAVVAGLWLVLLAAPAAAAVGDPDVAALQVGLRARGFYGETIDGVLEASTVSAVRALQRRAGIADDGIPGPATRRALGEFGRIRLGSRSIGIGARGWDVAAAQFLLAWQGFPSANFDGIFGPRVRRAVLRFQRWAGLPSVGRIGPMTLAALQTAPPTPPLRLNWPLRAPVTERFGPRHDRFHTGIDLPAALGVAIAAAGSGTVTYAGWDPGGFGYMVVIRHGAGVRTLYAHLSLVDVVVGAWVDGGAILGHAGATGHAFGPHLHFEVRLRGAAVDPLAALGRH